MTKLVWFKKDCRIHDHAPLLEASKTGDCVIPLYVIEPELWLQPDSSRRHWHFLHDSLQELDKSLNQLGQGLIIKKGNVLEVLSALHADCHFDSIFSHEETGNAWSFERDKRVAAWCKSNNVQWKGFPTNGVFRRLGSRDDW